MSPAPISSTISAGTVAQEVRAKLQIIKQNTNVLKKETPVAPAEKTHQAEQLNKTTAAQKAALTTSVKKDTITLKDTPIRRSREERVYDRVMVSLTQYKEAKVGTLDRIVAIQKVMEGCLKQPKKHLLDAVLAVFKENKDNPSWQETQALQRIATLTPTSRLQLEIFFRLFMMLATKQASKKNVSLNQVRSIFKNEDFLNWIAVTMNRR